MAAKGWCGHARIFVREFHGVNWQSQGEMGNPGLMSSGEYPAEQVAFPVSISSPAILENWSEDYVNRQKQDEVGADQQFDPVA